MTTSGEPLGAAPSRSALLDLVAQLALGVAALALVLGLADAEDRRRPASSAWAPSAQRLVGLAEVLAPLGVADDDAVHADLGEHRRRDLARERAGSASYMFCAAIADLGPRAESMAPSAVNGGQIDDLDAVDGGDARQQRLDGCSRLGASCASSSCRR